MLWLALLQLVTASTACKFEREDGSRNAVRRLATIPYAASVPVNGGDSHKAGVTIRVPEKLPPTNILATFDQRVELMDQEGRILRRLRTEGLGIDSLSEAQPLPGGGMLIVDFDRALVRPGAAPLGKHPSLR
jgi:hypothetical protein